VVVRQRAPEQAGTDLCAKLDGKIVGYAYARLEPRDWNALLDTHGALHDILVADEARRQGIGKKLLERTLSELRARGAARVVLHSATKTWRRTSFSQPLDSEKP